MRIALVAPGGVGGFFGGLLARAGEEVVALARGAHLAAIQQDGLRIEGPGLDTTLRIEASDDAAKLGPVDIVLFAVKLYQAEAAARAAAPFFGRDTLGISLLNGVQGPEIIAAALPDRTILGGCAYVSAVIAAPGHIRATGSMCRMVFGNPEEVTGQLHAQAFASRASRAGIDTDVSEDVRAVLWTKLIGLAANAGLTTAARLPAGPLYSDPDVLAVAAALIGETAAVARASGVRLAPDVEAKCLALLKSFPPGMYASMYHDIARGGPLEVEGFSGHILREAKRLGVPTPHHAALYAVLKPHAAGRPTLS
jgi:2-dehydropantoate 2-reductase